MQPHRRTWMLRTIPCKNRICSTQLLVQLGIFGALLSLALAGRVRAVSSPPVVDLDLGVSTQGRLIRALRVGSGPRKLVLVGDVHGGPERNTFELVVQLMAHFRTHPEQVPPSVRLYIIPTLNPDGLALGIRQNANTVDLNRNMDTSADTCPENDWKRTVAGAYGIISDTGGPYSESEIESRLIRDFLLDANGVIFFHTSGAVVFPACNSPASDALGRVFAQGAGYQFIPKWEKYLITGGMHDWAGGLGIAAITPELATGDQPETAQNLAGVLAALKQAGTLLPQPEPHTENGVSVQPIIWRAWRAWGSQALFGLPLAPPEPVAGGWRQIFERATFVYRPDQTDSTRVVTLDPVESALGMPGDTRPEPPHPGTRYFPETQHNLAGVFGQFWQVNGGRALFGTPLSSEVPGTSPDGVPIIQQRFERAIFQRPTSAAGSTEVRLATVGRLQLAQIDSDSPASAVRAR